jgi:hypothetical protein
MRRVSEKQSQFAALRLPRRSAGRNDILRASADTPTKYGRTRRRENRCKSLTPVHSCLTITVGRLESLTRPGLKGSCMCNYVLSLSVFALLAAAQSRADDYLSCSTCGERLPAPNEQVGLWWASSGWKIGQERDLPQAVGTAVVIRAAKNEAEAAQLVVRPANGLKGLALKAGTLAGPGGATMPTESVEILQVRYVNVVRPTDKSAVAGWWPDPLPALEGPVDLEAGRNQPFWIRVKVPRDARAGVYEGKVNLTAEGFRANVPLQVEVYDFTLPDRMTCTTAFGFSPGLVFRYQGITDPQQKRDVLDKYWASFGAHHISPYDPAPLDDIRVTGPTSSRRSVNGKAGRRSRTRSTAGNGPCSSSTTART